MYKINETVIYQNLGICKIVDIRYENFSKNKMQYYVLTSLYDSCSTKIYVPVGSEAEKFKTVLSDDEISSLIDKVSDCKPIWTDNDKIREERFSKIINDGNRVEIIKMICEIHDKKDEKSKEGKKLRISDERTLKQAETMIGSEFSFVLGIPTSEVGKYIVNKLK